MRCSQLHIYAYKGVHLASNSAVVAAEEVVGERASAISNRPAYTEI